MKLIQREDMKEQQRLKKEGLSLEDPDTEPEMADMGMGPEMEMDDGDLFGPEEPEMMEVG